MIQREWREVTRSEPCPACGKPDWCAWTAEGWLKCERETQAPAGMRRVSVKDSGAVFCPTDADEHPHHQNGRARIARKAEPKPNRLYPDPQAAVSAMQRWPSLRGCELAGQWPYHDAEGELVGLVVRFNEPGGGKTIRPISRVAEGWVTRQIPLPRPLYGLPQLLAAAPGVPIVVCEGEKSADARAGVRLGGDNLGPGLRRGGRNRLDPGSGTRGAGPRGPRHRGREVRGGCRAARPRGWSGACTDSETCGPVGRDAEGW
ncbi:MAG: hypothetical protein HND58_14775 [Planctomycetota bacterium]|nr:MAG: hypothetical protein HND58_14775 [Planctomycetota bacterium]